MKLWGPDSCLRFILTKSKGSMTLVAKRGVAWVVLYFDEKFWIV